VAVIVAAAAAVAVVRRPAPVGPPPPPPPAPVLPAKRVDDKSIAVLPFANMSDDKENAFFTEGIQEDILTNLALVHELRVVSRTSVLQYRDTTKPIRQIAAELGVAYILEGSVRREGNKVRVTGQLIHAATDEHVWAKAYDRDLNDIFGIQSELSRAIAAELQAALSPAEKVMLDRRPTENPAAYDLYLKARRLDRPSAGSEQIQLLEKATALDPGFARAWGDLADGYAYQAFQFRDIEENRAKAKAAIDQAMKLDADDPEVVQSLGTYYYYGFRDYARANDIYQQLLAQRPNDAGVHNSLGLILRREGKWSEALTQFRRATELDVADLIYLKNLISCLEQARRYDELAAAWRRMAALQPGDIDCGFEAAVVAYQATGSRREAEAYLAHLNPEVAAAPPGLALRAVWADATGNIPELLRLRRLVPHDPLSGLAPWEENIVQARLIWKTGDQPGAIRLLGSTMTDIQAKLAREPDNPRVLLMRALVEAIQGKHAEALQDTRRSMALLPESTDAVDGGIYGALSVGILDDLGEKDLALAEYQRLFRQPGAASLLNVYVLKADPLSNLRGDPRFQALLDDPRNNAPLF
jgi:TolB-like protein/Tfp pilus assembly protein PilF